MNAVGVPLEARIGRGWRLGLDGMRRLYRKIGPVRYPVILVGGTNGKGSVSFFLHEILRAHGMRVGLTTSPHLMDVRERIIVDGRTISVEEFEENYAAIAAIDDQEATYFETIALMAIRHFARASVDAAVVEIGLGGRHDAFNVLEPEVSVITSVGLEHTRYLGETLDAISIEKAQIARAGRPVVVGSAHPALRDELERIGAIVHPAAGSADYREANRHLALAAARLFFDRIGRPFDEVMATSAVESAVWPGRFQLLAGRPAILLDAAHNPAAARALALNLERVYGSRRIVALAAFLDDKDVAGFFNELRSCVSDWVITHVSDPRALPAASVPAPDGARVIDDRSAAFRAAAELAGEDLLLITGSIYLLGEIMKSELARKSVAPFPGL